MTDNSKYTTIKKVLLYYNQELVIEDGWEFITMATYPIINGSNDHYAILGQTSESQKIVQQIEAKYKKQYQEKLDNNLEKLGIEQQKSLDHYTKLAPTIEKFANYINMIAKTSQWDRVYIFNKYLINSSTENISKAVETVQTKGIHFGFPNIDNGYEWTVRLYSEYDFSFLKQEFYTTAKECELANQIEYNLRIKELREQEDKILEKAEAIKANSQK